MIIVCDANGNILNRTLDNVYQGSNLANKLYIIAPLSASLVVNCNVKTAKATSELFLAKRSIPISDTLNMWYIDIETAVSQYYGTATFQFAFYNDTQIIASGSSKIEIQRGVDIVLPAEPTEDVYQDILEALSQVLGDLDNKVTITYVNGDNEQTIFNDATGLRLVNTDGTNTTTLQITADGVLINGSDMTSEQYVVDKIEEHNTSETTHSDIRGDIATNLENIGKIVSGETVVGKTTADANGNNIIDTYQTKENLVTSFSEIPSNSKYTSEKLVKDTIDGLKSTSAYVFDTYNDFINWLAGTFSRPDGVLPSNLNLGNEILLKETDKPDYWYSDNVTEPITINNFSPFESNIDLTNYVEQLKLIKSLVGEEYTWNTAQNKTNILLYSSDPSKYNLMFLPGADGILGSKTSEYTLKSFSYIYNLAYTFVFLREIIEDDITTYTEHSIVYDRFLDTITETINTINLENTDNKVTSLSESSTDEQYTGAKLVYDQLALKEPLLPSVPDDQENKYLGWDGIDNKIWKTIAVNDLTDGNTLIKGNTEYGGTISDNFDTITKSGFYTGYGTATGAPNTTYSWFLLHENSNVGTASATQKAVAYNSSEVIVFIRVKMGSTWGAWVQLEMQSNKVTSISSSSTDTQYASAKAVYDALQGVGGIPEAPIDGKAYGRQDGEWTNLNMLIDNAIQQAIEDVLLGEV